FHNELLEPPYVQMMYWLCEHETFMKLPLSMTEPNKYSYYKLFSHFFLPLFYTCSSRVTEFALYQNYPNPFNPSTTIKFDLPDDSKVILEVYSVLGENAATLLNEELAAGYHQVKFNAEGLAGGVYIYRLNTSTGFTATKKLMLLK
ncbi:MAG: T9SS type A sorting domain-containing protein, partial [Ignavibacteriaceae bacterium]|nr:T9SS type A sorting domain-containing protein [Ignavibacteriaceae bacterium]